MTSPPIAAIEVRGVRKSFDSVEGVVDVSFAVGPASITVLMGPNGAGKSTMIDLLSGFATPDSGTICLAGRDTTGLTAERLSRMGVVRTFQSARVFADMSVLDNLLVAAPANPGETLAGLVLRRQRSRRAEADAKHMAEDMLETFGLRTRAHDLARTLSGGQRKLLDVARALMTRPSIVMLDEPLAGMHPTAARALFDHLRTRCRRYATTFLVVEHDMEFVLARADKVIVMAEGRVIATGTPSDIRGSQLVAEAYFGLPPERSHPA